VIPPEMEGRATAALQEAGVVDEERPPKVGDTVLVTTLNQRGELLTEPKDGQVQVAIGSLKVRVPYDTLKRISDKPQRPAPSAPLLQAQFEKKISVSPELHLRGIRADEAIVELDKYLDDAYLAGMQSVRIIHGKGTGTLRKVVHEHLKNHPAVKAFRLGEQEEGGWGATVVEFKEE